MPPAVTDAIADDPTYKYLRKVDQVLGDLLNDYALPAKAELGLRYARHTLDKAITRVKEGVT